MRRSSAASGWADCSTSSTGPPHEPDRLLAHDEAALDADKGVPLAVKLAGTIGFQKDGKRFTLKVSVDSAVSGVGTVTPITAPAAEGARASHSGLVGD
jgi:hypothetical protein